jgi:hypothetical protein
MDRRFSLTLFCVSVLAAFSAVPDVWAQGPDIFVTPVPNAPFSAVIDVQRSMVQPNGAVIHLKSLREIGRDSKGRIHNEARELLPVSSNDTPRVRRIHLYDPQNRMSAMVDPNNKTFWTTIVNHPPSTIPPTLQDASPTGNTLPANDFTRKEDLGTSEMEGVTVHGVRDTQSIPADASGTGHQVVVVDEYWYSEDLRINMLIKHNDPRAGAVTLAVTQVSRAEPNAAMFQIPENYRPAGR